MSKETLAAIEHEFILSGLRQGYRHDGRGDHEYRELRVSFGRDYGHVNLQLGKTSVIVRISATVGKPHQDRPFDGTFNIQMELTPMGSPGWESGRPSEYESQVLHVLDRVIRHSNALDTESLCIVKGVSCWNITAYVHVVDYDGNLTDSACMAIMAALQHFRRPDSESRGGEAIIYGLDERVPVPLNITRQPLCVSVLFFNDVKNHLIDPTYKEELAADGEFVIGVDDSGLLCFYEKMAGAPSHPGSNLSMMTVATDRIKEHNAQLQTALRIDLAQRAELGMTNAAQAANDR
ncbi:hypothetical protein N7540_010791 [Penicillium herquei]|nr:hypothetical protein N7540_010791 [Penicillium herquei]